MDVLAVYADFWLLTRKVFCDRLTNRFSVLAIFRQISHFTIVQLFKILMPELFLIAWGRPVETLRTVIFVFLRFSHVLR